MSFGRKPVDQQTFGQLIIGRQAIYRKKENLIQTLIYFSD
jgi:hypothetical protein